ncbi:MAG: prepilin-type N-terminal cleavage/methylation domain-containing protein [Saccharofermentans sp.]|nr:prepilin-type N-terminal cleavage/methylation domain-containing protein [Saccharofermentans sp.]
MQAMTSYRHGYRDKKGFSLPELLIAIALMAFVATAAIGGIVVVSHVRETVDKQVKANMIMVATASYLRADLNDCMNPHEMNCSQYYPLNNGSLGSDFYYMRSRYIDYVIKNSSDLSGVTTEKVQGESPQVQYWNSPSGICVGIKYAQNISSVNGMSAPANPVKYIIAESVMEDTGMYSRIKDGKIYYSDADKIFTLTIEIVDANNPNEVIMSQELKVCPDVLMPYTNSNP